MPDYIILKRNPTVLTDGRPAGIEWAELPGVITAHTREEAIDQYAQQVNEHDRPGRYRAISTKDWGDEEYRVGPRTVWDVEPVNRIAPKAVGDGG